MSRKLVKSDSTKPLHETRNVEIDCPLCMGSVTLMAETSTRREPTDPPSENMFEDSRENYLCVRCGYTSTSDMIVGSEMAEAATRTSPKLVSDLSVADNAKNIIWFPAIINISPKGICYPDGTPKDWAWVVAPYVPLTEEELESYLSTDKDSTFKYRLAVEKSTKFDKLDFQNALAFLGALAERAT